MAITPEAMAAYRENARRRAARREAALVARREAAWAFAHRAAEVLRVEFGARRVAVFGSLAGGATFDERSDVDLAAWGVTERLYYRAVGRLLSLDAAFMVDLVRYEDAPSSLRALVDRQGRVL